MSSKLALHLQAHPGWSNRSAALWIKIMDPPGENRWPGLRVVGRVYIPAYRLYLLGGAVVMGLMLLLLIFIAWRLM